MGSGWPGDGGPGHRASRGAGEGWRGPQAQAQARAQGPLALDGGWGAGRWGGRAAGGCSGNRFVAAGSLI